MSIGKLRHRVTIEKWTAVAQPGGGVSESWAPDTDVSADGKTWADVSPLSSKRLVIDDKVVISDGFKITLRWATGRILDQKCRIVYNGQDLTISGVKVIDERKRWYVLTCLING